MIVLTILVSTIWNNTVQLIRNDNNVCHKIFKHKSLMIRRHVLRARLTNVRHNTKYMRLTVLNCMVLA